MSKSNKVQHSKSEDKSYRLVVFRSHDMSEVRSFDLTLGNVYTLLSAILIVLSIVIIACLVFTPLKKMIPGYGKIEANEDFIALIQEVNDINRMVTDQQVYLTAMQRLILSNGDSSQMENLVFTGVDTIESEDFSSEHERLVTPTVSLTKDLSDSDALWRSIENDRPQAPVEGIISVRFDPLIKHFGIDILAPAETPIRSILDGYVISSGWDLETGYTIGVQHKGEIISFYKHNSILLKEKGTFVSAGEALAIIGNTGALTSGPHLHFEFWHHGKPINPEDIINFN